MSVDNKFFTTQTLIEQSIAYRFLNVAGSYPFEMDKCTWISQPNHNKNVKSLLRVEKNNKCLNHTLCFVLYVLVLTISISFHFQNPCFFVSCFSHLNPSDEQLKIKHSLLSRCIKDLIDFWFVKTCVKKNFSRLLRRDCFNAIVRDSNFEQWLHTRLKIDMQLIAQSTMVFW